MGKDKDKDKKSKKRKDKDKHKKKKHYSSSDDSDDENDMEERKRLKAERLAAKVAKHLKQHGASADAAGYTNDDNRFGDTNVSERFVWNKKLEKQIMDGAKLTELTAKAEKKRQREREEEIEKVKKRRSEREAEREAIDAELAELARARAVAEAVEMEAKEEEFHLEQALVRSRQRLLDGRARPIDVLAKNLHLGDDFDMEVEEPYHVFRGLPLSELRDTIDDIAEFQTLDVKDPEHVEFWRCMAAVAAHEAAEAEREEEADRARLRGLAPPAGAAARERGLHESVHADVQMLLAGKTHAQLEELEAGIGEQLDSGEAADPEYWAAVLRSLGVHKAKARLRELHRSLLARHLLRLKGEGGDNVDVAEAMGWRREEEEAAAAAGPPREGAAEAEGGGVAAGQLSGRLAQLEEELQEQAQYDAELAAGRTAVLPAVRRAAAAAAAEKEAEAAAAAEEEEEEEEGQWSPAPLSPARVAGQDVVAEEDDERLLELLRAQVRYRESAKYRAAVAAADAAPSAHSDAERTYQQLVNREGGLGGVHPMMRNLADAAPRAGEQSMRSGLHAVDVDDEATRALKAASGRLMGDMSAAGDAPFTGELAIESQVYWWHEKYKPRRPKYFNRVHTGYEWNKYNQTHYDSDNPPPKVVQGYKFNIFYPDLIDKQTAPTYHVEPDPQSSDGSTCVLRFHAGPPYEDIAFRIVNKEWEYASKRGFKSQFERGIMHLYFNFKRQRYRR